MNDFIWKNIKAIIHSLGYKIITFKKSNSQQKITWLAQQKNINPALFIENDTVLINNNKYFTVQVEAKAGINHLREALVWLIKEAISLNRTPLVFIPHFDSQHNFDIDINTTWDKYINLHAIELINTSSAINCVVSAVMANEIANIDTLSTLWIEKDHVITAKENATFDIIVRHNKTGLKIDTIHNSSRGLPDYSVRFIPSKRVLALYTTISHHLKNYCAIHVRRGDMLKMTDVYPTLNQDTHPDNIKLILADVITKGSTLYILTNERDKDYFNSLKDDYDVLQYFDFPELKALIEGEQPDNFLLFEIEKLIFDHAATKIYTFTHPKNGQRISLSKLLGWA